MRLVGAVGARNYVRSSQKLVLTVGAQQD